MTAITGTQQYAAYNPYARTSATNTQSPQVADNAATKSEASTNITLSEAAKAALSERTYAEVTSDARSELDKLLTANDLTSPYRDGKLAINLSELDRREIFAIATNSEDKFTTDEQRAAGEELAQRFDTAMAGPAAVARVTDEMIDLYEAAEEFFDEASPEEKLTSLWATKNAAVVEAIQQLTADPTQPPELDDDPVADYLLRISTGDSNYTRDFNDIADDARIALDKQHADANDNGQELLFSETRRNGQMVDFSKFDSRSLSAIALNEGDQFSAQEVFAAKMKMNERSRATLLACINHASETSDPTALSKKIISAFGSMSPQERSAAGWSDDLYQTAILNYASSAKIADMFSGSTEVNSARTAMNLLNF